KAGDRIELTFYDITRGEIHAKTLALVFDAALPVSRKLSVAPPRTLAKDDIPLPPIATNAAWSRRIARGATIRPLALVGLGDGHCNVFVPEDWRVAGHAEDNGLFHVMADKGFLHAIYKSGDLDAADAGAYVRDFLTATFGAPVVLTPPEKRPFGFVL